MSTILFKLHLLLFAFLTYICYSNGSWEENSSLLMKPFSGIYYSDRIIPKFAPGGQYFVLTISGGPHPETTLKILAVLRNFNYRATFFLSEDKIRPENLPLIQSILREKHDIGISNSRISGSSTTGIDQRFAYLQTFLTNHTGRDFLYYQPLHYTILEGIGAYIQEHRPTVKRVLWTIDLDYLIRSSQWSTESLQQFMKRRTTPGDILRCLENQELIGILPTVLKGLLEAKFELATVTDLLTFPNDSPK